MRPKNYPYKASDGNHWADAPLGDHQFYAIDFSQWLTEEGDELLSVSWEVSEGLEGTESHESGTEAYIKLKTLQYGSFRVTCTLITEENGLQQTKVIPMMLRVY